ncbi:MAG TPA: hypothetical protein DIU15_04630, partial [Deltaproteobacteria bacterium]|nr:hypothetical protein [Deltaproteobacteria bacterium]
LNGGQFVSATLTFLDDEGDIDLRIKDSTDTALEYSSSSSDNEAAAHGTDVNGTFYINARLFADAGSVTGNTYDMEIEVGTIPTSEADCTDDIDNDFDGDEDCADDDCASLPACEEDCSDGIDNDGDFDTDCADDECASLPQCIEDCGDGVDNDGDFRTDCADSECALDSQCVEDCVDGIDNDSDGDTDCEDAYCASDAACECATDPFEPNNGADVAATLGLGTTNSNLSVCSNDEDWYSFSASGVITAALTFSDVEGDVDARLYDAAAFASGFDPDNLPSSSLGYGTSVSDDETITYDSTGATTPPSGDYVLRVYLYSDDDSTNCVTCAWGNTYGLNVTATP